jgi:hypothetical protein
MTGGRGGRVRIMEKAYCIRTWTMQGGSAAAFEQSVDPTLPPEEAQLADAPPWVSRVHVKVGFVQVRWPPAEGGPWT